MKQQNLVVTIAVTVILCGVFFFAYYRPKAVQLSAIKEQREAVETEVAKLRQKKREMDKIEQDLKTLQVTLKSLETIIPEKREISDILSQFQGLAYSSRLNITKFTPRGETPREFYAEWPIPIEITGNYHNLGIFFDRLSRFPRLFTIERFAIKALSRQTDLSTISASFTSKTYIFLETPAAAPPQAKKPTPKTAAKPAAKTSRKGEIEGI